MKLRPKLWALAIAASLAVIPAKAENSAARWTHSQMPSYPTLLRNLKIGGHVKLLVTLTTEGKVKQTTVRGGNPMLAELTCMAVKKWVATSSPADSKVELDFNFDPASGAVTGGDQK